MRFRDLSFAIAIAMSGIDGAWACSCGEIPDSSYVVVTLASEIDAATPRTVTISPDGRGETFAANGVTITAVIRNVTGAPCGGIPAAEMVLWHSGLCVCPGGNIADGPTDANGHGTFTGTIFGGGCAENLTVYHNGVPVGTVPIRINSADANANCFTDAGDISHLARALGSRDGNPNYTFCVDFNEDGYIAAPDISYLASRLGGGGCP